MKDKLDEAIINAVGLNASSGIIGISEAVIKAIEPIIDKMLDKSHADGYAEATHKAVIEIDKNYRPIK